MKFKLVEKFDETRSMVQEYMYDAMDQLNNASLEEYIQWFKSELTCYGDNIEQAVTDAYIEACDYGMIKGVEKTRLTSELKEYIESHTDLVDDTDELMRQCPSHLQHELKIVLSKLDESLTEASNSVTKAFSDKVMNGHTSNVRGSDIISDSILTKYNMRKLPRNQHYVIHHRDGNHKNISQGNEFIMSNIDRGRVHKLVRDRIQSEYFSNKDAHKVLDYVAHVKQITTFVTKLKTICKDIGIDENKVTFDAPSLDGNDVVKRYTDLINSNNDAIKKINCEVFDDFFEKYQFLGSGKNNVRIAEYSRTQEALVDNN